MSARKRTASLNLDAALLREARDRDINLSATLERELELRKERRARWLDDNRQAIRAYNEQVEAHGAFADMHRRF
jgi:antitoxin CcdA